MKMTIARIVARYLSGAMMAYGIFPQETANFIAEDQDIIIAIGAAIGIITEAAYGIAKRKGWTT